MHNRNVARRRLLPSKRLHVSATSRFRRQTAKSAAARLLEDCISELNPTYLDRSGPLLILPSPTTVHCRIFLQLLRAASLACLSTLLRAFFSVFSTLRPSSQASFLRGALDAAALTTYLLLTSLSSSGRAQTLTTAIHNVQHTSRDGSRPQLPLE
jgi:hypothetical protein